MIDINRKIIKTKQKNLFNKNSQKKIFKKQQKAANNLTLKLLTSPEPPKLHAF